MCFPSPDKICTTCGLLLEVSRFGKKGKKAGKVIYDSQCKDCRKKYFRNRYKKKKCNKKMLHEIQFTFQVVEYDKSIPMEKELRLLVLKALLKER